jgi:predicted RecB family endonuclease
MKHLLFIASQMASQVTLIEHGSNVDTTVLYDSASPPPLHSQLVSPASKKSKRRCAAYVVTNGRRLGVFLSW